MKIEVPDFNKYKRQISSFLFRCRFFILASAIFGVILNVFNSEFAHGWLILFLICFWVLTIGFYSFSEKVSIVAAFVLLIMCPFLMIFGKEAIAERIAIWVYIFLVVGVTQQFLGYLRLRGDKCD